MGLFYADHGRSGPAVSPEAWRGFLQFVAQARLGNRMNELSRAGMGG